jgi:hypothetical protein
MSPQRGRSATSALRGNFELTVETEGILPLPFEAVTQLGLVSGDLLSLEPGRACLRFEIYHEFLADNWHAVPPENRWLLCHAVPQPSADRPRPIGCAACSQGRFPTGTGREGGPPNHGSGPLASDITRQDAMGLTRLGAER